MGLFGFGDAGPQLKNPSLRMLPGNGQRNAKAVIEGVDANGKTQWIDANPGNMQRYGLNPQEASSERVRTWEAKQGEAASREELRQQQAARQAREGKERDRAYGLQVREADRADLTTNANIEVARAGVEYNKGMLGVHQQAANTNELIAKSDADYKHGTLSLNERQRIDQNRQFDQTHLLAQQQNAMNYNLTATRLNNDIEAQNYDRRLRTMEGIGAAIAGLANMLGG